eukprot:comp23044_c1_seq1/m.36874 comp23044_c1_seq1/g.36874  ORF comp23044_c1_seq1/g.36874 comp23044_c1_seq1/m.36874 type:complete len:672 (-) comp23044_c1_seq1:201-2216(-)
MGECLKTTPEIFESNVSECLAARTKALAKITGLGPPDLCHITKVQERQQGLLRSAPQFPMQMGSYHYCYGVDCSSPASIAAYFNTLVNDLGNPTMSKGPGVWRIQSGTYCSYNAFARVDVRIEVTMPGTVNAYVLDAQGRRFGCDDRIWQEVHVCAILRALNMPSPVTHPIDALKLVRYLSDPREETFFLKSAEVLFWEGKYLGTDELTSPPNNINNRLAVGLKNYFFRASRYQQGIDFFTPFIERDLEVSSILAEAYDQLGQTSQAICLLARSLAKMPNSPSMLMKQSQLLLAIGDVPNALEIAKMVVDLAPAQAQPWINLATLYTAAKDYAMALVALNVTPMAHGTEFRLPEMPEPMKITNNNEVMRDMIEAEEEGDQTLGTLPANALRGTFVAAYGVLTRMLTEITWDDLLSHRSKVFLMEEEYTATFRQQTALPNDDKNQGKDALGSLDQPQEGEGAKEGGEEEEGRMDVSAKEDTPTEEQKVQRAPPAAVSQPKDETVAGGKRLLERWLDQLFTALYQDLMCSVIWNAQEVHARKNSMPIEHTVGDYLRYGKLTQRLNRKDDALRAFQKCTSSGFCLRGLFEILEIYSGDGFVEETLTTLDSIYTFFDINTTLSVPRPLEEAVWRLISKHGLNMLRQLGHTAITKSPHIKRSVDSAVKWKVHGYDK